MPFLLVLCCLLWAAVNIALADTAHYGNSWPVVNTWNGRSGVVVPLPGDYSAPQVGLGNVPNVDATNGAYYLGNNTSEAALQALVASNHKVFIPCGAVIHLTTTLAIDNASEFGLYSCGGQGETDSTIFYWDGPNGGTPLSLSQTRDSHFEGFSILPGTGTIGNAIIVDEPASPTLVSTNDHFKDIHIGAAINGVAVGLTSQQNNDLHTFEDISMDGDRSTSVNGFYFGNGQSKMNRIIRPSIYGFLNGVDIDRGSAHIVDANFSYNYIDVYLNNPTDEISIDNPQSEGASRFLYEAGKTSVAWPVTIHSGRFWIDGLNADGKYIINENRGPLNIIGSDFSEGLVNATFQMGCDGSAPGGQLNLIGNNFPNNHVLAVDSNPCNAVFLGNNYITGSGAVPYGNIFTSPFGGTDTLSLQMPTTGINRTYGDLIANAPCSASLANVVEHATDVGTGGSDWRCDGVSTWRPVNGSVRMGASGIPFIVIANATAMAGGELVNAPALPTTYSGGSYVYLPANAYDSNPAGFYYAVWNSTTAATVYNSEYTSGWPSVPSSPASFTAGNGNFDAHNVLVDAQTIPVPANAMGKNGELDVSPVVLSSGASGQFFDVSFGGAGSNQYFNYQCNMTGNPAVHLDPLWTIRNENATNSQTLSLNGPLSVNGQCGLNSGNSTSQYSSTDTTGNTNLYMETQVGTAVTGYSVIEDFTVDLKRP